MMASNFVGNTAPRFSNDYRRSSPFTAPRSNGDVDFGRILPCVARLPSISESVGDTHNILDHFGSQLLEDMESILEGITKASTTETVLDECRNYAKPCLYPLRNRDLTGLMTKRKRQWLATSKAKQHEDRSFPTRITGYHGLKEHMEQYLEEALARILLENAEDVTHSRGKIAKSWSSFKAVTKQKYFENTDAIVSAIPIVWVIQPTVRNGKTKFKFSTDFGPCFFIREEESIEFVEILKRFSKNETDSSFGYNIFYQVYTMDSRESRVVKSDVVSSLIEEMTTMTSGKGKNTPINLATMARQSRDDEDNANAKVNDTRNGISMVATSTPITTIIISTKKDEMEDKVPIPSRSHGLVKRVTRYLNRQRLKRLIHRQVGIALGNTNGQSR
jgi:hypothetical protein